VALDAAHQMTSEKSEIQILDHLYKQIRTYSERN